jgi:hypothetical protein
MANYGKYDLPNDDNNLNDGDLYECKAESIKEVLEHLKKSSDLLSLTDTAELCEHYTKLFPPVDGYYTISENRIKQLNNYVLSVSLAQLVKLNVVDLVWSDEDKDFIYKLKTDSKPE